MNDATHPHTKKQKKLAQLLKNRRTQQVNFAAQTHARNRDLDREREEEILESQRDSGRKAERKKREDGEPVWSAKLQEIRDRNTGRSRMATERWNRFAGTAESGGRGL